MERKIQFMLSQKSTMKTKLENMYLQKRISYGYRKVINMMLLSGVISIIAIGILFANMMNYVNNVNAADQAVKTCRININTAARNIREMALNDDESTYDSYEEKVEELLGTVDTQMNVLHGTVSLQRISIQNIKVRSRTGKRSDMKSWKRLRPARESRLSMIS